MRLSNLVVTTIETKRNWNKVHHIPIHRLRLVFQHLATRGAVSFFLFKCTSLVRGVEIPVLHLQALAHVSETVWNGSTTICCGSCDRVCQILVHQGKSQAGFAARNHLLLQCMLAGTWTLASIGTRFHI